MDEMDDSGDLAETTVPVARRRGWLHVLRPTMPAVIGAAALTFLFAAVMPLAWVFGIGWNLYLDRLSDLFVAPVGNGARLVLALGLASVAALVAAFVALVIAEPEASGLAALRRRLRRREAVADDIDMPVRRRADLHPDDLPRAPIRAGRDLPAAGLGPLASPPEADVADVAAPTDAPDEAATVGDDPAPADELVLADLAPVEVAVEDDLPWLQPADHAGSPMPDPADRSLGAMVARFEAGLTRRRQATAATAAVPVPDAAANEDGVPEIDLALDAALSTLQRMNRGAIG